MSKSVTKKTVNAEAPKQKKQQENKKKLTSAPTIIECDKFDISKFSVEELALNSEFNKKKGGQLITFPRYQYSSTNKTSFTFKTKPIKFTQYGIKKLDDQFVTSDEKRDYMRIPYDASQPACVELFKMFETIDKYFEENKATVLGPLKGFTKVFKYQPIVRTPQEHDDLEELQEVDDDSKKKGKKNSKSEEEKKERMKYAKIKFATDFNTHELKTYVFSRENGTPELCKEVKTITQLTEYLKWNSVCQFLITASKVWYAKSKDDNGNRKYGITFKCPQMEVIERLTGGARQEFTNYAFGDSNNKEEDEDDDEETNQKNSKKKEDEDEDDNQSDKNEEKDDEDEEEIEKEDEEDDEENDEEDDEEDDEEEEEEKETKKDSGKKSSSQKKKN